MKDAYYVDKILVYKKHNLFLIETIKNAYFSIKILVSM